jgi:hypothetical protein
VTFSTILPSLATLLVCGACNPSMTNPGRSPSVAPCTGLASTRSRNEQLGNLPVWEMSTRDTMSGPASRVAGTKFSAMSTSKTPPGMAMVSGAPRAVVAAMPESSLLSAGVKSQNGGFMTGRAVSWTSNTVSQAVTDTSGTGSVYPNLPAGMSVSIVDDFTESSMQEAGFVVANQNGGSFTRQDGSTWNPGGGINPPGVGPVSSPYIGTAYFPAGMPTGVAPGSVSQDLTSHGWSHLYVAFWFKVSSNWSGNTMGISKIGYIWINGKPEIYFTVNGAGSNPLAFSAYLQDAPVPATFTPNQGADASVARDVWYRVEMELVSNTLDSANGVFREWSTRYAANGNVACGPALITEYNHVQYAPRGGSTSWGIIAWAPVYGGLGNPVPHDQYQWMDRIAVAGQ